MPNKITSWLKSHVTQYKIDFMSLNRLRLNQTVSGQIPVTISLTEKTRMATMPRLHLSRWNFC